MRYQLSLRLELWWTRSQPTALATRTTCGHGVWWWWEIGVRSGLFPLLPAPEPLVSWSTFFFFFFEQVCWSTFQFICQRTTKHTPHTTYTTRMYVRPRTYTVYNSPLQDIHEVTSFASDGHVASPCGPWTFDDT
jgi:hypothetical protein